VSDVRPAGPLSADTPREAQPRSTGASFPADQQPGALTGARRAARPSVGGFFTALRAPPGASLTTFTIFRYPPGQRFWAFTLMGRARRPLAQTAGLGFHRLLGSGSGLGFSLLPDFGRYALLATWSSEQAADDFFAAAPLLAECRERGAELWTVKLLALRSRGAWAGALPFTPPQELPQELPPELPKVALTRARLRLRGLPGFWRRVPAINRSLAAASGLRLALGVGELPWIRPVTFSVWDDDASLERFAFQGSCHHAGARAAYQQRWFREDLFARFAAIASQGQVAGRDPCGFQPDP